VSTFTVDITVANLSTPDRPHRVSALVDTGATYTTLPMDVIEDLGSRPVDSRQVVFADGREDERPITYVWVTLDGRDGPTLCLIGPEAERPSWAPSPSNSGHSASTP